MKRKLILLTCLVLAGVSSFSMINTPKAAAATFNQNQIIDDIVFDNSSTMSASQIDSFLNTFTNSCISPNSGFRAIDPTGYNPTQGYLYGGFVTAGQAIYDAAQAYGLNPQVLVTTLEKEQSLVTGRNNFSGYCNNGDQHKYAAAVGYGCPDSGTTYSYSGVNLYQRNGVTITDTGTTCVNSASKAGFSQQVIRAAWLLKFGEQRSEGNVGWAVIKGNWNNSDDPQSCYGGPMTQGTWQRCPSGGSAYYDGYTTIDGAAVHMNNGATAALYWYTPHFSGNQNFFNIFTSWFGPTNGSEFFSYNNQVFMLGANNTYYYVPSQALMNAYGISSVFHNVITYVNPSFTSNMTFAGNLPWIARFGAGAIYEFDTNGLHHFQSPEDYADFGYSFGNEAVLPTYLASLYPISSPMQHVMGQFDRPEVYYVTGGKKQHISTPQAYTTLGSPTYNTQPSVQVSSAYASTLTEGAPILVNGAVVQANDTQQTSIWLDGNLYPVSNTTAATWGLALDYTRPASVLGLLPASATTITSFVNSSGGTKYLLDGGRKLTLTTAQIGQLRSSPTFVTVSDTLLNRFTVSALNDTLRQYSSPAVYQRTGSSLYHIYSEQDLSGLGLSQNDVTVIKNQPSTLFTDSGGAIFANGRLVRVNGTAPVYLIDGFMQMRHVPSETMMNQYGFSFSKVSVVGAADLSTYAQVSALGQLASDSSSTLWVVDSGCKQQMPTNQLSAYGFTAGQFTVLSDVILAPIRQCAVLTDLIEAKGAAPVYQVSNGTKHWIPSESVFNQHGFSWSNVRLLSPDFVGSIPSGSNIQ